MACSCVKILSANSNWIASPPNRVRPHASPTVPRALIDSGSRGGGAAGHTNLAWIIRRAAVQLGKTSTWRVVLGRRHPVPSVRRREYHYVWTGVGPAPDSRSETHKG